MADQPWDVFVSYARADDEPPMGAAKGWVTTLADELRKVLRRRLGVREARIFMDHRLAGNEGLNEGLLDAIRGSRTLLLLMSPGYRKSSWCQWELGRFLEAQTERNHRDHVFVLETAPLDRADWHPALQELIPIRFWHRDELADKAPRLMGFPVPKLDEDNPYWRNLNELAHLIAQQLEDSDAPPQEPRAKVWLAEPTEDLLDEHESVAATLRQQGFLVVPAAHLPRDGREPYLRSLRDCLEQAILGVQLLGPREGHRPAWGDRSFIALQAAAADEAARTGGLRVLRWRSRDINLDRVTSADYRALLTGGSVLAQGLEEFKQEILRAGGPRAKAAAPGASPDPPHPDAAPHVYVNAEAVDRDLGRRVLEALEGFGATSALPPLVAPHDAPDQIRRAQQDQLEACDGVVLVYGQAPPGWVQSQWAFARRTLAEQRRTLRAAVLDGPPSEKPQIDLRGPGILTLDCRAGFEPRVLADFVRALRPGAAHA
jgi:hypothetical protein